MSLTGRYRVALLTTVHYRYDTRIYLKEAASIAKHIKPSLILMVQDGKGAEGSDDIEVLDTGRPFNSRLGRMTLGTWRMFRAARGMQLSVAHLHDPELIPAGLLLKLSGIKVVYDVHEDLPRQIMTKRWLPSRLRRAISYLADTLERIAGFFFDSIIAATPHIAQRFPERKTITVQNFPILSELVTPDPVPYERRPPHFVYLGGIAEARGSLQMVKAVGRLPNNSVRLQLVGRIQDESHSREVRSLKSWARVHFHGWTNRPGVARILGNVRCGIVLFHPLPNHVDAQPNKMFEYMAAGLPIIASDFPRWREIVDRTGCGLLVDPLDISAIASAMQWILDHPQQAEAMGWRGLQAVEDLYNWGREEKTLVALYDHLLNTDGGH